MEKNKLLRMDNVGIAVESLNEAISFFAELGLKLEGRTTVEGEWSGRVTGLDFSARRDRYDGYPRWTQPARAVAMKGGTTFHFITDGIESALEKAKKAANGKDIRIGGGVSTIRQFLRAGYIDEMDLAFSPVFLGSGERPRA